MIEIHRDNAKLDVIIECDDKKGKNLGNIILKGKTDANYKKALLEMLMTTGLLPYKNVKFFISITDNTNTELCDVHINCQFLNITEQDKTTYLASAICDPASLFLDLELTPEYCLNKFTAKLKQVKNHETYYLDMVQDIILVHYI